MKTATTRPALSTITVRYSLSTEAAGELGPDALDVYEAALTAALSAEHPGAEVDVTVRLANVDASSFDATCETDAGVDLRVRKNHFGAVTVAVDPDEMDDAAQSSIEESFARADRKAWERACESV